MKRNIITIATSKKLYIDLAVNLAMSFIWWHKDTTIDFYIVTDQINLVPNFIKQKIKFIEIKPGELGEGFSSKLHLDHLAPEGQTLFIDSDCLIFGYLDNLFEKFKGNHVSVLGNYITEGEWFGDVKKICKDFNISKMPKFNGGIYYLEKGNTATEVYTTARELEKKYDEIGFVRLRNRPNDEVIMALAMALHQMKPLIDDGTVMSDPQACQGGYKIDVINGKRWMLNPAKPNLLHQNWYPFEKVEPLIVHFLGTYIDHYPYQREIFRLKRALKSNLNIFTEVFSKISIEYPNRVNLTFKNLFRPIYKLFFGNRSIKKSERIV
ncbi:hypothetical protein [Pedobacter sp. Hv1]|uniref:hypothetical protein n=1 Tax=Pedobacter sp. Hv1 TaxID=1740090 RepID=UPI0006D8C56D|nr:hypothetical protein [Pedobacter sp. Hv1]KQC02428.1 hypothetical protein AQF98_02280 [Pedobacter sp. Hv1]